MFTLRTLVRPYHLLSFTSLAIFIFVLCYDTGRPNAANMTVHQQDDRCATSLHVCECGYGRGITDLP